MKTQKLLMLVLTLWTVNAYGQDDIVTLKDQILEEGLFLFRLEKASWNATDVLMEDHAALANQLAGYLSYPDQDVTKTIFWNDSGMILATIVHNINTRKKSTVDANPRAATQPEADLIDLRNKAFTLLMKNEDSFFAFYKNTSPNLIPVIRNDQRTVFILTGSREKKLVLGNDYKLSFNDKNEVLKKEKLHNSLITIDQNGETDNQTGSAHTHILENQPYITSTDICTLMLYADVFKLKSHVVVSEKGTSIFESDKKRLIIVPQDLSKEK